MSAPLAQELNDANPEVFEVFLAWKPAHGILYDFLRGPKQAIPIRSAWDLMLEILRQSRRDVILGLFLDAVVSVSIVLKLSYYLPLSLSQLCQGQSC